MRKFFDSIVKPVDNGSTTSLYLLFCFAAGATVVAFLTAGFLAWFEIEAGQYGDFVGGTLNPVLTFLTFMGLIITIVLQQQELADTRAELRRSADALEKQSTALDNQLSALHRQNFEATFFQMLSFHNQLVSAMDIHRREQDTLVGRDCFRFFYEEMKRFNTEAINGRHDDTIRYMNDRFWLRHHQDLAHYYRYFYNLIRFVDESEVEKPRYTRILRAQLSNYELIVMFYNSLRPEAEKSRIFIEKYALFDNLDQSLLFSHTHPQLYDSKAFNETEALVRGIIKMFGGASISKGLEI